MRTMILEIPLLFSGKINFTRKLFTTVRVYAILNGCVCEYGYIHIHCHIHCCLNNLKKYIMFILSNYVGIAALRCDLQHLRIVNDSRDWTS